MTAPAKPASEWHHNAVKTHCHRGHAFDEDNTYVRPDTGHRQCRQCRRLWQLEHLGRS